MENSTAFCSGVIQLSEKPYKRNLNNPFFQIRIVITGEIIHNIFNEE